MHETVYCTDDDCSHEFHFLRKGFEVSAVSIKAKSNPAPVQALLHHKFWLHSAALDGLWLSKSELANSR